MIVVHAVIVNRNISKSANTCSLFCPTRDCAWLGLANDGACVEAIGRIRVDRVLSFALKRIRHIAIVE